MADKMNMTNREIKKAKITKIGSVVLKGWGFKDAECAYCEIDGVDYFAGYTLSELSEISKKAKKVTTNQND